MVGVAKKPYCLILFILVILITVLQIEVFATTPNVLFADGFESGNTNSGGWTSKGCENQILVRYAGSRAAMFNLSDHWKNPTQMACLWATTPVGSILINH